MSEAAIVEAVRAFLADGVRPVACEVRAMTRDGRPTTALDEVTAARGWAPLRDALPRWRQVSRAKAVRVIAACRYRTLAYGVTRGDPATHHDAARSLVDAMGADRAWVSSSLFELLAPKTLALPQRPYAIVHATQLSGATFEQSVVLASPTHAALLVWADED